MGWTKVCETALSGIWVLQGNPRARMCPDNLVHLRVGWRKQGYIRDCLGYARARPSSIRLDHGDILVMDGLAQSEYEHCTASGLQGPRVNLTCRWVAQHTVSCPLAGVVGCVLPTCAQGLVEPSSRWLGEGESKLNSSWGLVLLLLILVSVLLVGTLINIRRWHRHRSWRPSYPPVHFSSRGRARWVGGRRWALSRRRQSPRKVSFYFGMVSYVCVLLSMLVAKREPTPCYHDAYSVGTSWVVFFGGRKAG